jgi:hypothetical protein
MTHMFPGFDADALVAAKVAARDSGLEERANLVARNKVRVLRYLWYHYEHNA